MSLGDRVWNALTGIIKLEDRVTRQAEALRDHAVKIDDLHARVVRLEAQLELLTNAAMMKRLKRD